jgi:predicted metal-binding membrane protein
MISKRGVSVARSNAGLTALDSEASVQGIGWTREWGFLGISALLFIAGALGTIRWCESMSGGMAMPGGWTMSMAWMRMPGQTWLGAAASFVLMWVMMMVAMMLPSLVPMLLRYRGSVRGSDQTRLGRLTALAGAGYLFVWAVFGAAVYPLALVLTAAYMRWSALARSVPIATGFVLMLAGCFQLTAWKARQLGHCRDTPAHDQSNCSAARSAWQNGLRLGAHCSLCCFGFMLILLATGVMRLGAMAIVATAITAERLSPKPQHVARVTGIGIIATGVLVITRALGVA